MEACYDVAVIGAGIAGSAVSKLLADKGWKTLLLDRRTFPRHKVCGEFLSPEALSMLEGLGVKPEIEARNPAILTKARLVPAQGRRWRSRSPARLGASAGTPSTPSSSVPRFRRERSC
ncbi:FAD-dependent monooxygenase [Paenibacillus sp. CC-CFT747]|nr:FAD-dependent monooxygenase [Paenibacillus sp. CC-CFT747]